MRAAFKSRPERNGKGLSCWRARRPCAPLQTSLLTTRPFTPFPNPLPATPQVVRLMLDYGRKLQRLANEDDLVPGLGLPSLHGGEWEGDAKSRDVREVFRMFTEEVVAREVSGTRGRFLGGDCLVGKPAGRRRGVLRRAHPRPRSAPFAQHTSLALQTSINFKPPISNLNCSLQGAFTPAIDADLKELAAVLCLGAREAADVRSEVAAGLYRKLLREEVTSRRIDDAEAPAKVLSDLVSKSGFSAEAAAELHKSLYRQKMNQVGPCFSPSSWIDHRSRREGGVEATTRLALWH